MALAEAAGTVEAAVMEDVMNRSGLISEVKVVEVMNGVSVVLLGGCRVKVKIALVVGLEEVVHLSGKEAPARSGRDLFRMSVGRSPLRMQRCKLRQRSDQDVKSHWKRIKQRRSEDRKFQTLATSSYLGRFAEADRTGSSSNCRSTLVGATG